MTLLVAAKIAWGTGAGHRHVILAKAVETPVDEVRCHRPVRRRRGEGGTQAILCHFFFLEMTYHGSSAAARVDS
jgi:hypothetical protein